MNHNQIKTIDSNINLKNLLHLSLADNLIYSIGKDSFKNLTSLEELHLGMNKLKMFDSELIKGHHKLNKLHLYGNKLRIKQSDMEYLLKKELPNLNQILFHFEPSYFDLPCLII